MPRKPEPWYREDRNGWYVNLNGKRHFLGEHPAGASKPEKNKQGRWNAPQVIDDAFHKLMLTPATIPSGTIWEVFDSMLDWTLANRAKRTYDYYKDILQRFKDDVPNVLVEKFTPDHVYRWLNGKDWGDTYKRGCMTTLCRAFNWAVKARKITFNPIRGIEKPEASHRETLITEKEFEKVLALVTDEPFRDILTIIWLTGCRPFEAARVEARHVTKGCWEFPKKEGKGKRPRVVFLVPEAERITKKWMERNPEGPIFRNNRGRPWTAMAFSNRFGDLKKKVGRKLCMYAIRHSYIHHGLTKGKIDPVVMATLAGHSNTNMILNVYGHLLKDVAFMRKAAGKVRKGASVPRKPKRDA